MKPSLIAIVPAAGIGARAGGADGVPKQYRLLEGEPMLRRAVRALLADPRIAEVRVAVSATDAWAAQALAGLPRTVWRPCGGPTRAATVRAALQDAALAADAWVLVHDAARPGLPAPVLARLIDACLQHEQGGLLALPVADTVKQAMPARRQGVDALPLETIAATLPREHLWLAQTPQMFRAGELSAALDACTADERVTDEASAVELSGGRPPLLVPGSRRNDKLTWPEDFEWFESWLRGQAQRP
ncbi:MAG: 2-C-methyl-D-erythritol 4-phosphate cytidylyltransferase [Castellaniella sp.]|uniref:2-C-methyl-D-erythritol 4-phosphate cytidylyltransferase n=1 Tax=Castellaniella sp. TaxID=1955812 RepID=UPI003C78173E